MARTLPNTTRHPVLLVRGRAFWCTRKMTRSALATRINGLSTAISLEPKSSSRVSYESSHASSRLHRVSPHLTFAAQGSHFDPYPESESWRLFEEIASISSKVSIGWDGVWVERRPLSGKGRCGGGDFRNFPTSLGLQSKVNWITVTAKWIKKGQTGSI
jgi:hypothetical protein